jgi:hypothetical protein
MLANNVQESTTTTGTGNITLLGSSENGRTFTSQYANNVRFPYIIDDGAGNFENGVGYLLNSTTLVRDEPMDGSSTLPVNFGAGTKQVFVGVTVSANPTAYTAKPSTLSDNSFASPHASLEGISLTVTANTLYYSPFILEYGGMVDGIGYRQNAGLASGTTLVGLYDSDSNGDPSQLIVSGSIATDSGGLSFASLTAQPLKPGKYWAAFYSNSAVSIRSGTWIRSKDTGMTGHNFEYRAYGGLTIASQTLSSLPQSAIQPNALLAANFPLVLLRVQ